jgi:hypothetical protein
VSRQTYPIRGGLVTKETKGRRHRTVPIIAPLRPTLEDSRPASGVTRDWLSVLFTLVSAVCVFRRTSTDTPEFLTLAT